MSRFTTATTIEAPASAVWAALDDVGSIARWNPGVSESHRLGEQESGLGARRHCDLGKSRFVKEEVVEHVPGTVLTMRVVENNLPLFETADIRFDVEDLGERARVSVSPEYRLRRGALGGLMDRLMVRRTYRKGMAALLEGLKRHVEGGG